MTLRNRKDSIYSKAQNQHQAEEPSPKLREKMVKNLINQLQSAVTSISKIERIFRKNWQTFGNFVGNNEPR